jgi:hypothetical protein
MVNMDLRRTPIVASGGEDFASVTAFPISFNIRPTPFTSRIGRGVRAGHQATAATTGRFSA